MLLGIPNGFRSCLVVGCDFQCKRPKVPKTRTIELNCLCPMNNQVERSHNLKIRIVASRERKISHGTSVSVDPTSFLSSGRTADLKKRRQSKLTMGSGWPLRRRVMRCSAVKDRCSGQLRFAERRRPGVTPVKYCPFAVVRSSVGRPLKNKFRAWNVTQTLFAFSRWFSLPSCVVQLCFGCAD